MVCARDIAEHQLMLLVWGSCGEVDRGLVLDKPTPSGGFSIPFIRFFDIDAWPATTISAAEQVPIPPLPGQAKATFFLKCATFGCHLIYHTSDIKHKTPFAPLSLTPESGGQPYCNQSGGGNATALWGGAAFFCPRGLSDISPIVEWDSTDRDQTAGDAH